MKTDPKRALREKLRARIRGFGLRCTAARLTVLSQITDSVRPLSHAEIALALTPLGFDRATVYRNLVEMAEVGLLSRVDLGDHVWRFELRGDTGRHADDHPHFLCTQCGEVSCLSGIQISIKPNRGKKRSSFGTVTDVLLKGLCTGCA